MFDIDIIMVKKNVEEKRHSQVVNILKKFVQVTTITKRLFDLRISLIIGNLLIFALTIEKQLIKTIFDDKVVQF